MKKLRAGAAPHPDDVPLCNCLQALFTFLLNLEESVYPFMDVGPCIHIIVHDETHGSKRNG